MANTARRIAPLLVLFPVLMFCTSPAFGEIQVSLHASEAVAWMETTENLLSEIQSTFKNLSIQLLSHKQLSDTFSRMMRSAKSTDAFDIMLDAAGKEFIEENSHILERSSVRRIIWIYPTAHGIIYAPHEYLTKEVEKAFNDYGYFFYILEISIKSTASPKTNSLMKKAYERVREKHPTFFYLEDSDEFVLRIYPMISSLPVILGKTVELEQVKRMEMMQNNTPGR